MHRTIPANFPIAPLFRRIRNGSEDAATQLYLRYARRLRAMAHSNVSRDLTPRVDAEDVVQSVFRTFVRRVAGGEYEIPDGEELWGLLLVIRLNKVRATGAFRQGRSFVNQTLGKPGCSRCSCHDSISLTSAVDLLATLTVRGGGQRQRFFGTSDPAEADGAFRSSRAEAEGRKVRRIGGFWFELQVQSDRPFDTLEARQ